MSLLYENKIPANKSAFIAKVIEISGKLNINPNWLMFCINLETAGTFSHTITNGIGATGLIQFTRSTAAGLGTTTDALRAMSNVEQLDYVYKYLKWYSLKFKSFEDVYLAIFYPAMIGKPDNYAITSDKVVKDNPLFDTNRDLDITKAEVRAKLLTMVPAAYYDEFLKKK